jgi:hypothetical protein
MAVREAAVADFIQGQLAAEKKKQLHAYISYYDMFKDAHKVKVPVEGSGEEFMRLAAEQILMVSGAPRRDHRDLTAFMKALNKTSFGQQTAKICRLEHLDGQGNDITERNKLPPFIDSCFQDAFKDPLSIREDLKVLIGLGQYLDPASRNINGELVGFNGGGLTRTYTKEELENIGIWGVQSIQGRMLSNNECEATIIINYTGMNIAEISTFSQVSNRSINYETIKCKFTSNFKPITPDTKDYFLGNATKNRWFNANADRRIGANTQVKRDLYRTAIKFLICKEIGDTFQVLFHSLYASSAEPSSPIVSSPERSSDKDMSICMLTCDNVVSSRSRLEGNTVLARSGNAENDEEDEEKDKFGEYTLYYKGDAEVEKRGLISMFCNNSIRNNEKVIAIIDKILNTKSLEIQGIDIDFNLPKTKYITSFLNYIKEPIRIYIEEINTIKNLVNPNQSAEEVRKFCISKEAIIMFKEDRNSVISCIYTLEYLFAGNVSYAELLEGFFKNLANDSAYASVATQLTRRATTAEIAASKLKKPQLGSILLSLLSNVPLLTTRDRPTRSRMLKPTTPLNINVVTINQPTINPSTINPSSMNNNQVGGLYHLEEENLKVSEMNPSFTMRDHPNEMYRYTVQCIFLDISSQMAQSESVTTLKKEKIHFFSPTIIFHFFNLMYYYFNYIGEICAEKNILKRCIYSFLNGSFSSLSLEEFEVWYLREKASFISDGLREYFPDLSYYLIRSSPYDRSVNEDEIPDERAKTARQSKRRTRLESLNKDEDLENRGPGYTTGQTPYPTYRSSPTSQSSYSPQLPIFGAQTPPFGSPGRVVLPPIVPTILPNQKSSIVPIQNYFIYNPKATKATKDTKTTKATKVTKSTLLPRIPTAPGFASNSQNTRGGRQTRKRKYRKTRKTRKNYE